MLFFILQEYTFGLEKSGTLNTYAVMKSEMKRVDSTGRRGPIPSAIGQKRLVFTLLLPRNFISLFQFSGSTFCVRNEQYLVVPIYISSLARPNCVNLYSS
jgi:hypothetical protein